MLKKLIFIILIAYVSPSFASEYDDNQVNEIAEQYVKLVLAVGEYDKSYVDAYYGPAIWLQQTKERKIDLKKIVIAAKSLQDLLQMIDAKTEIEALRVNYLSTQLSSLSARALMLLGRANYSFDQEAKALYDTQPPQHDMKDFSQALSELDSLLAGEGTLSERVELFKKQFVIPKDKLKVVFDKAIEACRERTNPFVNLLAHENFKLEFVSDKPWSGYNWYKGDAFSLIQVNTELDIDISRAIDLGCHEGYPGHHTYNGLLEANLVKKRGWIEFSVYPLFSPQSLIAEGSANYGIEMAFPGSEKIEFEKKHLFPLAGIDPNLAEQYYQFSSLVNQLSYVGNEVARQYMNESITAEEAVKLLQDYQLMSLEKAKQRIRFIDTYGAYVINYNWGKDLVKNWVESGDDQSKEGRWKRFSKLLSSPMLPSSLR